MIPPQNVKEVNKTITSLFITWDVVPTNQNLELIPEFKVIYSLRLDKKEINRRVVRAPLPYINLTGLKIHRRYNITVLAFNQCGDGPSSAMLSAKTDEDSKFWHDVLHCINLCCCSLSNYIPTPRLPAYHPFYLYVYPFFSLLSVNVLSKQALQEEDSSDWRAAFHHIIRSWTQLPTSPPIYQPKHSFVYPPSYLFIYLPSCRNLATYQPIYLFMFLQTHLPPCLPIYGTIRLPIYRPSLLPSHPTPPTYIPFPYLIIRLSTYQPSYLTTNLLI